MSKSFCVDLNVYSLCRVVGSSKRILQGAVGAYDIAMALRKLGYSNLDEFSEIVPQQFGTILSLDEALQKATLGIPADALVQFRRLGGRRSQLLLTFTY